MPLRSGLMFEGVVPQVGGCWGGIGGVEMSLPTRIKYAWSINRA